MNIKIIIPALIMQAALVGAAFSQSSLQYVDNSFKDFSQGTLGNSGANLYITRKGSVKTIHRYDFNNDGYVDLVFAGTHDFSYLHNATLITPASGTNNDTKYRLTYSPLAVEGSIQAKVADLNGDGYDDVVFCPNNNGSQNPRRFLTIIWGGENGWPASRSNGLLPVRSAKAIAIVDLNHDGNPDIAVLCAARRKVNGASAGHMNIRVYFGSKKGFFLTKRQDFSVPYAGTHSLAANDFDNDGAKDLAILTTSGKLRILWATKTASKKPVKLKQSTITLPINDNTKATCIATGNISGNGRSDLVIGTNHKQIFILPNLAGRKWGKIKSIELGKASQITISDLDNNGSADLILTQQMTRARRPVSPAENPKPGYVHIFWANAQHSYAQNRMTSIPIDCPMDTAAGDMNGDGKADLAVAIYHNKKTFNCQSLLFYNKGKHTFTRASTNIPTKGAVGVTYAATNNGKKPKLIFCNKIAGTVGGKVPLRIYWGSKNGPSPNNKTLIPFACAYQTTGADFNNDGYTDMLVVDSGETNHRYNPYLGANIFWGSANGISADSKRTVLREYFLSNSNTADLNKDGYLDLVLGSFQHKDQDRNGLIIYYGTAQGFNRKHRAFISLPDIKRTNCVNIADYNNDGWLDIATSDYINNTVNIFWGSPQGYSKKRLYKLRVPAVIALETADLNNDGYLDLLAGSYDDPTNHDHDTGMTIFWGSSKGFKQTNAQWLPSMTPLGITVADFDNDGYLDIFNPSYLGNEARGNQPCYLYWGSAKGFSPKRRTTFICDSPSDAMAADFNHDGRLDLVVSCHTKRGNHHSISKVFYNDGNRFANPKVTNLPTIGPHWMYAQDMGNIYTRKWQEAYTSRIFHWNNSANSAHLSFDANIADKAHIHFRMRTAPNRAALAGASWKKVNKKIDFALSPDDRYLQYQALFLSDNGDRYPTLKKVTLQILR